MAIAGLMDCLVSSEGLFMSCGEYLVLLIKSGGLYVGADGSFVL